MTKKTLDKIILSASPCLKKKTLSSIKNPAWKKNTYEHLIISLAVDKMNKNAKWIVRASLLEYSFLDT